MSNSNIAIPGPRRWPAHGWVGLALVAAFWVVNWWPGLYVTHWAFFPLWVGYSLTVDSIVYCRKGASMLTRSVAGYAFLFVVSAPAWWLFEVLNWRTQNWFYLGEGEFGPLKHFLFSTLDFSTVMPAVFGTAELVGTFGWLRRPGRWPAMGATRRSVFVVFLLGWLMLALLMACPDYFFPFLWLSIYFILDPLNVWLGNRSLLRSTAQGDWRPSVALAVGCLICGFFWEMWNYYSFPKWEYRVPFVGVWHVFEMPLLGYGGYIPFSWEIFALYQLVAGALRKPWLTDIVQIE